MLRIASKWRYDIANVDLLAHAALLQVRLQRRLEPGDDAAWLRPTPGLVLEARITAQLFLRAGRMAQAQIVGRLGDKRIEHAVAGQPENVVGTVVFRPFHRFVAAVVAVAPPDDPRGRPVLADAPHDILSSAHSSSVIAAVMSSLSPL